MAGRRKPGRKCLLCTHPKREALNEAIAMGKLTMTEVAAKVGVNKSAVSRHFSRHLQPAMAAAGGGTSLAWDVKGKSRELTERMEGMLNVITQDSATGTNITQRELMQNWQAVRALGGEMREWMRLHGQATGELQRDNQNSQNFSIQIICPSAPSPELAPRISFVEGNAINFSAEEIGLRQLP
jgi:hypothetical protein